jgi:uncharacterized protein (TIGR02118 family)
MTRVLAIYNQPADPAKFDAHYYGTHIPLARKIPGLRGMRLSASKPVALAGTAPYLVAELDFDSMAAFQSAMASPEGQATAADVANYAQAGVTLLAYEAKED